MTISIKINNPYLMNRAHNYFYNKKVQTMLCNNETELTLFNLDRTEAELLLITFTNEFADVLKRLMDNLPQNEIR